MLLIKRKMLKYSLKDAVTETRLNFHLKKKRQNKPNNDFQTLDMSQNRIVILRRAINEVSSLTAPVHWRLVHLLN